MKYKTSQVYHSFKRGVCILSGLLLLTISHLSWGQPSFTSIPNQNLIPKPSLSPVTENTIQLVTVIEGERIYDAVTGELLEKPKTRQIPIAQIGNNYFDDGTHGDEVAGDGIYSNIVERRDVIGTKTEQIKQSLLREIKKMKQDCAVEFYELPVAALDRNTILPSHNALNKQKQDFISDYENRVMAPYKDADGKFYPVYVTEKEKAEKAAQERRLAANRAYYNRQYYRIPYYRH